MNNKAFQKTILIYFVTILLLGIIINYIINLITKDTSFIDDLGQVLILAILLPLGFYIGLKARLKPISKYLNSEIEKEPLTYISEDTLENIDISFEELLKKLKSANIQITFINENNKTIKICEKLKPIIFGSAATININNDSLAIRSFRVGDKDKKRLKLFKEYLIAEIKK